MASQLAINRRRLLHGGGLGCLGLTLGGLWRVQAASADSAPRGPAQIRACILIFYYGGPSHLDTFDMKPNAPSEIRGEFNPISSSVPGLAISEHLPLTARVMDKVAVVRSMHHTNRLHDSASIESLTGRQAAQGDREEFAPIPQFFPCYGAALSYLRRERQLTVPHAALPWIFHNVVGAYPVEDPLTPADLAATIYWRFGFDPAIEIPDPTGRPHRLAEGRPVQRLFG